MSEQEKNTEEIIFDAAQTVFIRKGFNGARMEEIAREAGINKALLHYYYRTKEKLFNTVFGMVFSHFMPRVLTNFESDEPIMKKIEFFIDTYIELLLRNPHIPNFIISEINRSPENVASLLAELTGVTKNDAFGKFSEMLKKEVEKGTIRPIDPDHLIVNILGLCVFPFVAKPILQGILFKNDKAKYQQFLEQRKEAVKEFIMMSIRK